jgi:hypothetical protein
MLFSQKPASINDHDKSKLENQPTAESEKIDKKIIEFNG